jgi:2-keto-3-deoxy-L-rhamnonate aldolase RhmA
VLLEHMTPATVRTMKRAGYDWLWIDGEHGVHSYETVYDVVRCAEDVGIITLFRVAQLDYARIAQALDMAVDGVIVPRVETPEQVRLAIDYAKYPPIGKRGFGMRASLFGVNNISMKDRIADQNGRFLIVQIETRQGAENIEAMLDVADGQLDGVFFGPADFQMDIGRPDSPQDPELDAAIRKVSAACAARGISNGTPVTNMDAARLWRDRDFNLLTYLTDEGFMAQYAEACRNELRQLQ